MLKSKKQVFGLVFGVILLWNYAMLLPKKIFTDPTSTVIYSRDGILLGARIASDGQWRFPPLSEVPDRFETCILAFEDRRFYSHPGVSLLGTARAIKQNIEAGRIVSGGSTITMQTIRLARKGQRRTVLEKMKEWVLATRLEWSYTKQDILSMYTSNAPFGGNVVGLQAAAWRYYGKRPDNLTWAEAATLAVLPNAPALIYPGRNQSELLRKRNRLLAYLHSEGVLDVLTYELAILEELPQKPFPIPQNAVHLLQRAERDGRSGQLIVSTLDGQLQQQAEQIVDVHYRHNRKNRIRNSALLVIDLVEGKTLAYVGNVHWEDSEDEAFNDMISTPRSSGSILKPFLYGAMLEDGLITPEQILRDIPINYQGFSPKNYDEQFYGAVKAREALARSLNIPAVELLQAYRVERFLDELHDFEFTTINRGAEVYGLSLILGGAEVTLWDLARAYRTMALKTVHSDVVYDLRYTDDSSRLQSVDWNPASSYLTLDALTTVARPLQEQRWQEFRSNRRIAWKTGTSYGFRDAWAVGVNARYVVAAWVGNANGEGQPGISGLEVAAPIMFEMFNRLPHSNWFERPEKHLVEVPICAKSGMRKGRHCEHSTMEWIQRAALNTEPCVYCRSFHVNGEGERVTLSCSDELIEISRFVLPPVQAWYYAEHNPNYKGQPEYAEGCRPSVEQVVRLIYPKPRTSLYIPRDLNGERQDIVMKAAHAERDAVLYWHLDDEFLGESRGIHQMTVQKPAGDYQLTLIDGEGRSMNQTIHIRE